MTENTTKKLANMGLNVADGHADEKPPKPYRDPSQPGKVALVIGGGAPNYTLMTGALLAADEAGVKFDVMSAAGGGGLVALLYLAPKNLDRRGSLKNSVNLGVSDEIYSRMPMNYKVFQKASKVSDWFRKGLTFFPGYQKIMDQSNMSERQKLASDLIQMVWALMTPSTVNLKSTGLCAHAPWVSELVDFEQLKTVREDLYFNAYCLDDHKMAIFDKHEIDARHFGASLSYPFFYSPTEINGKKYIEGASQDAYNFQALLQHDHDITTLVVLDSFSNSDYMVPPTSLWSSFAQEIITPLISLSRLQMIVFQHLVDDWNRDHPDHEDIELIRITFDIPKDWMPTALDWSRSNLQRNFDLGYETMKKYIIEKSVNLGSVKPH